MSLWLVAVVGLAVAGVAGRLLVLDDGPYTSVADVCVALDSLDAKALIDAGKASKDGYPDHACSWAPPRHSGYTLSASVVPYDATFWSGDATDRANESFDSGREFHNEYNTWGNSGQTIETVPGLVDEAYLLVSKRDTGNHIQRFMLLKGRAANATLSVSIETEIYPVGLATAAEEDRLKADFRARAPAVIADLVEALR